MDECILSGYQGLKKRIYFELPHAVKCRLPLFGSNHTLTYAQSPRRVQTFYNAVKYAYGGGKKNGILFLKCFMKQCLNGRVIFLKSLRKRKSDRRKQKCFILCAPGYFKKSFLKAAKDHRNSVYRRSVKII